MEILNHESKSNLHKFSDHLIEYLDTRWDMILLNVTEKIMAVASSLINSLILLFFGGLALIFASIGTAIWLGMQLDNPFAGYFIVAGIFVVLLVLALVFATTYIRNVVTSAVLESIKDDDDETTS